MELTVFTETPHVVTQLIERSSLNISTEESTLAFEPQTSQRSVANVFKVLLDRSATHIYTLSMFIDHIKNMHVNIAVYQTRQGKSVLLHEQYNGTTSSYVFHPLKVKYPLLGELTGTESTRTTLVDALATFNMNVQLIRMNATPWTQLETLDVMCTDAPFNFVGGHDCFDVYTLTATQGFSALFYETVPNAPKGTKKHQVFLDSQLEVLMQTHEHCLVHRGDYYILLHKFVEQDIQHMLMCVEDAINDNSREFLTMRGVSELHALKRYAANTLVRTFDL